jgi:hypothetical protein
LANRLQPEITLQAHLDDWLDSRAGDDAAEHVVNGYRAALKLVDEAAGADPVMRHRIVGLLFGGRPIIGDPPGNWPSPTAGNRARASSQCRAAATAARDQLRTLGMTTLYTTLAELPTVRLAWDPGRFEEALPPAPLVHSLVEGRAIRHAMTLTAYEFSPHMARLWDEDVLRSLMRRLNAFAELEINLWALAADAGHPDPPPYVVRFDVVRWLWHPSIGGAIFCVRCGDEVRYARRARTHVMSADTERDATRTARCRACSRGREDDWPHHAVEPFRRGTWLLRCAAPGCQQVFIGSRQARYCKQHRVNRLTPRMRPRPS